MSLKKEIPISTAKDELKRINEALNKPHILIGGLAVQQYVPSRVSKDIDLVCEHQTVLMLIDKLYPTKDYNVIDLNEDEFRPSYEILHRINKNKMIFLGPKIWERESYMGMNWDELLSDAQSFSYKGEKFQNILVPAIEILAFTKLLSFIERVGKSPEKGKGDLLDFINLTNGQNFKINALIDKIRAEKCEQFIFEKIQELDGFEDIWKKSLLMDFVNILAPLAGNRKNTIEPDAIPKDPENLFSVNNSVAFYDLIAHKYDERNTDEIFETHKNIIELIEEKLQNNLSLKVLDIGSGTGRMIAVQYLGNANIVWHCIEPSTQMREKFKLNLSRPKIKFELFDNSIFELPKEIDNNKYDVIILSFVLTSLKKTPDFHQIAGFLAKDGILLIADIAPSYTQMKPLYDFKIQDQTITLAPRLIEPLDIINELLNEELLLKKIFTFEKSNGNRYSFLLKFEA